ncbi:MAG TPA: hypothetical protein DCE42_26355 [Myxococcales bacterium]|nr:hypothetical protein [Deltaproteobacteria bacterium]MBU48661.1 hypothetical protein [Deltaproteobacteria bacterium]MBU49826.1 hypothetical protein [Deltaproteobacteria bacterium]HAA58313.1 hypothetical protein [Myxococcales bacterium]|tara:strand:+ start:17584 stop:19263 length:1680 start_codon:yes stop_codon:yes gene_type:complete
MHKIAVRWLMVLGMLCCVHAGFWGCGGETKPECEKDLDCTKIGEVCNEGQCVINEDPLCPNFCSKKDDCSPCSNGRVECVSNRCIKPKTIEAYSKCGKGIGFCGDGATCGVIDNSVSHGYCFPYCESGAKECLDGKGTCLAQTTASAICMPKGTGKEGDSCKFDPKTAEAISSAVFCQEGLHCVKDKCVKPKEVGKLGACGAGSVCSSAFQCVQLSQSIPTGFCVSTCESSGKDCDGGDGVCVALAQGSFCLPKGKAKEGAACGITANDETFDPQKVCEAGLYCEDSKCKAPQVVEAFKKCDDYRICKTDAVCLSFDTGASTGFCMPKCAKEGDACEGGKGTCAALQDGTLICYPDGTAAEGAVCGIDSSADALDPARLCKSPLRCADSKCATPQIAKIYGRCDNTITCPTGADCIAVQSGLSFGFCLNTCTQADAACDDGKGTCTALQGGSAICIPNGTAKEGGLCGVRATDTAFNVSMRCVSGNRCVTFAQDAEVGYCLKSVGSCSANACAISQVCLALSTGGVCGKGCNADTDCPSDGRCQELAVGNETPKVCIPK